MSVVRRARTVKPPDRLTQAVVIFVDVIQSSDMSAFVDLRLYYTTLSHFQATVDKLLESFSLWARAEGEDSQEPSAEINIRGDEVCVILYSGRDLLGEDLSTAVRFAVELKRWWRMHPLNLERIRQQSEPISLAAGIHFGMVAIGDLATGRPRAEGYCINFAKRVETSARNGRASRIVLSEDAYAYYRAYRRPMPDPRVSFAPVETELKGISNKARVWEVDWFCYEGGLKGVSFKGLSGPLRKAIYEVLEKTVRDAEVTWGISRESLKELQDERASEEQGSNESDDPEQFRRDLLRHLSLQQTRCPWDLNLSLVLALVLQRIASDSPSASRASVVLDAMVSETLVRVQMEPGTEKGVVGILAELRHKFRSRQSP
jgi:class 3 adenylate cyclase